MEGDIVANVLFLDLLLVHSLFLVGVDSLLFLVVDPFLVLVFFLVVLVLFLEFLMTSIFDAACINSILVSLEIDLPVAAKVSFRLSPYCNAVSSFLS